MAQKADFQSARRFMARDVGTVVRPAEGLETTADGEAAIFTSRRGVLGLRYASRSGDVSVPATPDDDKSWGVCTANLTKVVDSSADGLGRSERLDRRSQWRRKATRRFSETVLSAVPPLPSDD